MSTELAKTENEIQYHDYDILNLDLNFETKIEIATNVANSLSNVIETQEMYITLGGNKHVLIDGWETLGTMLGLIAITKSVVPAPEELINTTRKREKVIAYLAEVDIIDKNGVTIGNGKQIATNLEKGKEDFDHYAIYGMATTRAKGRAYRNCLGWIMKLAGYSGTPAEEMDNIKPNKSKKNRSLKNSETNSTNPEKQRKKNQNVKEAEFTKKETEPEEPPISDVTPPKSELEIEQEQTISKDKLGNEAINRLIQKDETIGKDNLVDEVRDMVGEKVITPAEAGKAQKVIANA